MEVRNVLPRDAIPSVDEPTFGDTYSGSPDDDVIVVETTPARAYPLRFLHYHEIVNDAVERGGESVPIAVTWCPLCGSAVVYERRAEGRTLSFGVSGKLADDDLVMYDRETGSEWKQSLGECIAGPLEGASLTVLPASMTTVAAFREAHPDGVVLQPPGGESEAASDDDEPAPVSYDEAPYREYFEGEGFGLAAHRGAGSGRPWDRDDIAPKDVVLGIERGDAAVGVPRRVVEDEGGVAGLAVGGRPVVVFATPDGMHAFEDPGVEFRPTDDPAAFRGDGTTWDGATGRSEDGRRLERVPAKRLFAFAWQDDHGPGSFYGLEKPDS